MKKLTVSLLMVLCGAAPAAPIDDIVTECVRQMEAGSCQVLNDVQSYSPAQLAERMNLGPLGLVPFSAYLAVRGTGDMRMCSTALDSCRTDWNGERCRVARAFWNGGN